MSLAVQDKKSATASSKYTEKKTSSSETEHKSQPSQTQDKPKVGWNKIHTKDSFERDTRSDRPTERRPLRAETGSTLNTPAGGGPGVDIVNPAANAPAAAASQGQSVRVTQGPLNFRANPSTAADNPPLTQIPQGAVVQVRPGVEPQNGFVPVTWSVNGEQKPGWIAQQFTEPAAPASAEDQQALAAAQQNFVNQFAAEKQVSYVTQDENGNPIVKQGDGVNANCGPSSVVMALRAQGLTPPAIPGIPSDGSNGAAVQAARYSMYQGVDGARDGVVPVDPKNPDAGYRYAPMEGPGNENSSFTGFDGFPSAVQAAGGVAETIPATSDGVAQAIREGKSVVVSGTFLDGATEKTDTWARGGGATLHVVAVTGMTSDGNFVVSDPAQNGPIIATSAQLDAFMRGNAGAMSVDNPSGAGAPAATSPTTAPAGDLRISNPNGANLRPDPSTAHDPKAVLSFGDVVHPVPNSQPQNGFVEVTWKNKSGDELRGWVYQPLTEPVAAGPAQAAPVNAVGAPSAGAGALDPTTVGYHLTPDALTNGDAEAQKAAALRDLDAAAQQGARSVTLVATRATDPGALKAVLDAAADKGIQVNVRVHAEGWKPTLPMKWDAASNTYQYDAAGGQKLKDTLNKLFTGLSEKQLGALGAVQLGNEPLDPKEWDGFAGEPWDGDPSNDGVEYQQKLAKKAAELGMSPEALAAQISSSMGLATRDMLMDVAPGLAQLLGGDRSKIATPAMGAGWTQYNNYAAQLSYFKGLMGMDSNNQVRGPSGLEYAGQVGMHAYLDMNANESQLDELTCLHAYEVALGEYAANAGRPAPGSETARPMFSEVGLDNRYGPGQGAQLAQVLMPRIDRWNQAHPGAAVADISVWGWYGSYNLEPQWQVRDPALADSLRNENPH